MLPPTTLFEKLLSIHEGMEERRKAGKRLARMPVANPGEDFKVMPILGVGEEEGVRSNFGS